MKALASSSKDIDITQSQASHAIKFGFLCTNIRNVPRWFGFSCFIVFHLQTIAMISKNASICLAHDDKSEFFDYFAIKMFRNLMIPSEFLSYEDTTSIYVCLFIMSAYILMLLGLAVYLQIKLLLATPIPNIIQKLWSFICYVHSLLLFFPIQSFIVRVIKEVFDGNLLSDINVFALVALYFNIAVNWILVFLSSKFFYVVIKTKDPISSKNTFIKSLDLAFKALAATLWTFAVHEEWLQVFILVATFIGTLAKDSTLFYVLPYYHIQTLELAALLQAASTTLALLSLTTKILFIVEFRVNDLFILVSCALLIPLAMMVYYNCLWRTFLKVVHARAHSINRYQVAHKRYILRFIMKKRITPHQDMKKVDWFYYIYRSKISVVLKKINKTYEEFNDDINSIQELVKNLMILMVKANPKDELIRVNLAYFYVKYEKAYLLANNIIEEILSHDPCFSTKVSVSLIRIELQKKLFLQYSHQEDHSEGYQGLNILKYVQLHSMNNEVKKRINDQIKLQISFWSNFLSAEPDMGTLSDISGKVYQQKQLVESAWNKFSKIRDRKFSSPLFMYGMYLCFINNDPVIGEKFMENYHLDVEKYEALTQRDELTDNTLFGEETAQITMSGLRTKLGRILSCSQNIQKNFGWEREHLLQRPITLLMPSYFRDKHDGFLMRHYHTGHAALLNQTSVMPVLRSDGFVKRTWIHIKINPMVETGLSYVATMRPVKSQKMIVLLRKDGTIDAMCKKFAQELGIVDQFKKESLKIFQVCPDLQFINEAFNVIAYRALLDHAQASKMTEHYEESSPTEKHISHKRSIDTRHNLERHLSKSLAAVTKIKIRSGATSADHFSYFDHSLSGILEIEKKVKMIYESFTSGSKLIFYPQRSYRIDGNNIKLFKERDKETEPMICNVQITSRIDNKDFIKILTIEKTNNEDGGDIKDVFLFGQLNEFSSSHSGGDMLNGLRSTAPQRNDTPTLNYIRSNSRKLSSPSPLASGPVLTTFLKVRKYSKEDNSSCPDESMNMSVLDELQNNNTTKGPEQGRTNGGISFQNPKVTIPERKEVSDIFLRSPEGETSARLLLKSTVPQQDFDSTPVISLDTKNFVTGKEKFRQIVNNAKGAMEEIESAENKNRSSVEVHDKESQKGEDLLKTKLKRLKNKFHQGVVDPVKVENSIGSSYISKGKKVESIVVQALKMHNKNKIALLFANTFVITIVFCMSLMIIQLSNIKQAITDIEIKINVIEKGFSRIDSILQLSTNFRLWNGILTGFFIFDNWESDNLDFRESTRLSVIALNNLNRDLRNEVSKIDKESQSLFYKKDVRIYEKEENGTLVMTSIDSNFVSIEIIINRALGFCNKGIPSSPNDPIDRRDLEFVLENDLDDLLIASENSVAILVNDLSDTLQGVRSKMVIIYELFLSGILVFFLVSIRYLCLGRTRAKKFMMMFFRLEIQVVQDLKSHLQHFMNSLDSNMLDFQFSEETEEVKDEPNNAAKKYKNFRKASMDRLYRHQISMYIRLCPFYIILIGSSIAYFIIALGIISDIDSNQVQIQSSLQTINQQDLLVVEIVEILMANSTTTIRNLPIEQDFLMNLNAMQHIEDLIDKFRASDRSLTPSQEEIFFSFPCSYFESYGLQYKQVCKTVSKGTDTVGLAMINSDLFVSANQIYDLYNTSSKSEKELVTQFYQALNGLRNIVSITGIMLDLLHDATSQSFRDKAIQIENEAIGFTIITILVAVLWALLLWVRVVKKIICYEIKDREILQLVPIKQILANRYLRQHLYNNSNGALDSISSLL